MSGELDNWLPERPPKPIIAFGPYEGVRCLNCGEAVSNPWARRHALVDDATPGCSIEFEFATSAGNPSRATVAELRPDLPWQEVEWAK
jgi:hypothetical protein